MSEHPRVLVEAARLQVMAVEERRGVRRRGFSAGEMERVVRELMEDQDLAADMEALAR